MPLTKPIKLLSFPQYLDTEKKSEVRHEYINGYVLAMAGASRKHNLITGNLFALLHGKLPEGCNVYSSDMLVRIRSNTDDIAYYPDIMVSCDKHPVSSHYETKPVLIAEVLSRSTERKDFLEKMAAYSRIESLVEYLLVSQEDMTIIKHTFQGGVSTTTAYETGDTVTLQSVGAEFPIETAYKGVRNV